jgi:hypothetical protein
MSNGRRIFLPSLLWSALLVAIAVVGVYLAYELVIAPRQALQDRIRELEQDKQRLETYVKILEHTERRARIEVLKQVADPQEKQETTIQFTETDDSGKPISPSRDITLPDSEVYIDTLVIKFEDHFVESNDPLKSQALMLFRRLFSSTMRPEDGFSIDTPGEAPEIYAVRAPSSFEKDLWKRFWEIANDANLAKQYGVRAIHGDAPYMRMEPDRVYEVLLRSTGEVIITPGTRLVNKQTP